jgi:isopenicillin N synthase-like dioxygenase
MLLKLSATSSIEDIQQAGKLGAFYYSCPSLDQSKALHYAHNLFQLQNTPSQNNLRGFIPLGGESGSSSFESKEAFSFGYEHDQPENDLMKPNQFPNEDQKVYQLNLYNQMCQIALEIVSLLSKSIKNPELRQNCSQGHKISLMRVFHYLSKEASDRIQTPKPKTGSSEHTDWGFLTLILAQPQRKGLEMKIGQEWIDIPPEPDHLIVNLGDYFSLLTMGEYTSPLHRVVLDPTQDRYSYVFFFYPDYESKIPSNVLENESNYSLFKNQADGSVQMKTSKSFGDWINLKWTQGNTHTITKLMTVKRNGYS